MTGFKVTDTNTDAFTFVRREEVIRALEIWFKGAPAEVYAVIVALQGKLNRHEYTGDEEAYLGIRIELDSGPETEPMGRENEMRALAVIRASGVRCDRSWAVQEAGEAAVRRVLAAGDAEVDPEWSGCLRITEAGSDRLDRT